MTVDNWAEAERIVQNWHEDVAAVFRFQHAETAQVLWELQPHCSLRWTLEKHVRQPVLLYWRGHWVPEPREPS